MDANTKYQTNTAIANTNKRLIRSNEGTHQNLPPHKKNDVESERSCL